MMLAVSTAETVRARFEQDTADHALVVLHDDGAYRHLRFAAPGLFGQYDLMTWPGRLAIDTPRGDYLFVNRRARDMLELFESAGGIDPAGWAAFLRDPCVAARAPRDRAFLWCCWAIVDGIARYRAEGAR